MRCSSAVSFSEAPERLTSSAMSPPGSAASSSIACAATQRSISGARPKRSASGRNAAGAISSPSSPSIRSSSSCWRDLARRAGRGSAGRAARRRSSSRAARMRSSQLTRARIRAGRCGVGRDDRVAVAAGLLGLVHREVGLDQQLLAADVGAPERRDPDARRHAPPAAAGRDGRLARAPPARAPRRRARPRPASALGSSTANSSPPRRASVSLVAQPPLQRAPRPTGSARRRRGGRARR